MKILVLGHRGMLGHVCKRYLSEIGYNVLTIGENEHENENESGRYNLPNPDKFFDVISTQRPNVIINCIGLIKQKSDDPFKLLAINSVLPLQLSIRFPKTIIIHPSTDCIFSGLKGGYCVDTLSDPTDMYGISKALGEIIHRYPLTWVLRCSIIGPELKTGLKPSGLLEWFLSQSDNKVYGYINHKWNGITTLEWTKCVSELLIMIRDGKSPCNKIVQPGTSEIHSKFEMLHMFSDVWKKDIQIISIESGTNIDRSLKPTWKRKPFLEQLKELYDWYYHI